MHLGRGSRRDRFRLACCATVMLTVFVGCSGDDSSPTTGTAGSGGTGGAGTGGASGGNSGTAGAGGESGSAGSGGAAGSGATGGSAGSGGAAGSGGSAGSGAAGASGSGGKAGGGGAAGSGGSAGSDGGLSDAGASPLMNFFVTSDTSKTGDLGGLTGADARCQRLATAIGQGSKTWRAYLSTEAIDGGASVNARDRIGAGPYYNSRGVVIAADSAALHARKGDADLFIDENGGKINGQWTGSPTPVEHDVLTGSMADGTVMANMTCVNWTSSVMTNAAQVGHADGLGPGMDAGGSLGSWNSAHANGGCNDTAPRGGAGRLYCFVGP